MNQFNRASNGDLSADDQASSHAFLQQRGAKREKRRHPERSELIEGHTDSVGNAESSQRLSRRRADSVRSYLARRGVSPDRLSTSGMGKDRPVASNESATGRQQNRRAEVIIENAPQTSAIDS